MNRPGSALRGRLERLSDKRTLAVEIAQDAALFVEQEEVRGVARQGAHDDPCTVSGHDGHGDDAVIVQLLDLLQAASLYLRT